MDKKKRPTSFDEQSDEDKDMTMFVMTNLILTKDQNANMVYVALWLKRKPAMELLTTFLTTILLLLITFTRVANIGSPGTAKNWGITTDLL